MKLHFSIEPIAFKTINELPGAWGENDYRKLLEAMEYGDVSDLSVDELKEMCLLSLSDNEADDAAKIVLAHVFGHRLNNFQIDNLSHEMIEERIWEEYAELSMHEEFFNVTQLLYEAYNGKFPHPQAVRFNFKIIAKEKVGLALFEKDEETALIRLLVQGMPQNTLLNRLFEDQMEKGEFPDAKDIVWQFTKLNALENSVQFEIISSSYWFHDFKYAESFEAMLNAEE